MKLLILTLISLLYVYEARAARISYSLCCLDAVTDAAETPYNSQSTCGLRGTRLVVTYEIEKKEEQFDPLWSAEIKFIPSSLLVKKPAPKLSAEPSTVILNCYLYGEMTLEIAKTLYLKHYSNLDINYQFPARQNGDFQYGCYLATQGRGFSRIATQTELFRWEKIEEDNSTSLETIISHIGALRTFNNGNDFPPYCAKSFTLSTDALNCITFSMRLLKRFGIPVDRSSMINHYLENTSMFTSTSSPLRFLIAYPARFLKPLAQLCFDEGGIVNRNNISDFYNEEYYGNPELRRLLEPERESDNAIQVKYRDGGSVVKVKSGNMWIIAKPGRDIRAPIDTLNLAVGIGGAAAGYLGVTASSNTLIGGTAMLAITAQAINSRIISYTPTFVFNTQGDIMSKFMTVAIFAGAGYAGMRTFKRIINWF